jgi:hypothetical protein
MIGVEKIAAPGYREPRRPENHIVFFAGASLLGEGGQVGVEASFLRALGHEKFSCFSESYFNCVGLIDAVHQQVICNLYRLLAQPDGLVPVRGGVVAIVPGHI